MRHTFTMKFMKHEERNVDNDNDRMNVKYVGFRQVSQVAIT